MLFRSPASTPVISAGSKLLGKIEYADYRAGDVASGKVDLTRVWVTLVFNY